MNIVFTGKTALVTGAGRGIGRQIAKDLAQGGAHVYALSRSKVHLESLLQECRGAGKIEIVCVDLEDVEGSRKAVEALGSIDLLVNNAGIFLTDNFDEIKMEDFDHIMNINVKSVINLSQVVVKGMKTSGKGGSIVNISSFAALTGIASYSAYSCTKSALDKLTQIMAIELGPHKIRVNSVNPQIVLTDMFYNAHKSKPQHNLDFYSAITPLQRVCNVDDVSNVVMFLLSDKAAMVTGIQLPVDGGVCAGTPPVSEP